jgi:hypothetical protein
MNITDPRTRLCMTLGAVCTISLVLLVLLLRPATTLRPDRSPHAFELDEPPGNAGGETSVR